MSLQNYGVARHRRQDFIDIDRRHPQENVLPVFPRSLGDLEALGDGLRILARGSIFALKLGHAASLNGLLLKGLLPN